MTSTQRKLGLYVLVAGPDGTGKTTVADELASRLSADGPVLHLHHRPRVLGGLTTHQGPVTEPHKDPPYPWLVSVLKVLYLFADHLLGWVVRMRPVTRAGGVVLMERGWWDLAVDPLRYRLRAHPHLVRTLGWLLPKPTLTLLLTADPAVLATRTDELDPSELERQLRGWLTAPARLLRPVTLDSTEPLSEVLARCEQALADRAIPQWPGRWIALPTPGRPRWVLPREPRRAAANGLRIYTPVTRRAIAGWMAARLAAHVGLARFLPPAPAPAGVLQQVADLLPPGGTVSVGRSTHPSRSALMLLDAGGDAVSVAKLAADDEGRAALAGEHAVLEDLRDDLPTRLQAPRLVDARAGRVVYEAVAWRPRWRPWVLPMDVAWLLGRLYRAREPMGHAPPRGVAHGDCAPWNLLRAGDGWYLVDWEDASVDAQPFTDLWHYICQGHSLLGRPTARQITGGLEGRGWIGRAIGAYAAGADLPLAEARTHLVWYLQRSAAEAMPDDADAKRRGTATRRLLTRLGAER